MALKSINDLEQFAFQDAHIEKIESSADVLTFIMSGVICKKTNRVNETCVDIYNDTTTIRCYNPEITKFFIEGMKVYNPDGKLVNEVPDEQVNLLEYKSTMDKLPGAEVFVLTSKAAPSGKKEFCFELCMDLEDEDQDVTTYWMEVEFDKVVLDWDRFLNKAEV